MSHNIVLSHVRVDDLGLLDSVVRQLSKGAARLIMNQKTFRTYRGQPDVCEHCIQMPGNHDIGLVRAKDGGYEFLFDPYTMDDVFAVQNPEHGRAYSAEEKIGGLLQEYVLRAAEERAAMSGYSSQRVPGKDGTTSLVLERSA